MRLDLLIILVTIFLVINTYNDGKYLLMIKSWKKYYQIGFYLFLGISLYVFIKKNPMEGYNLFKHAHRAVKYMPIDKDSKDIISPFLDISSQFSKRQEDTPQFQRMMTSGTNNGNYSGGRGTTSKRCVSETKKKFVASNQNWICADCQQKLPAWFEVDHKIRLEYGGDNSISNLVALCRDCHGKKTALENMG